jgi:hypothetical protein
MASKSRYVYEASPDIHLQENFVIYSNLGKKNWGAELEFNVCYKIC